MVIDGPVFGKSGQFFRFVKAEISFVRERARRCWFILFRGYSDEAKSAVLGRRLSVTA